MVHAVVALVPGSAVGPEELPAHCERQQLARFKLPKAVEVVGELPKNAAGKILRRALREPFWAGHERRVHQSHAIAIRE